jgi:sulfate transport system substrate-binding protein
MEESGGKDYQIVVPSISILAEPPVALVDKNVDRHGTRKLAQAYLQFLYSPQGQALAAKHHFRPAKPEGVPAALLAPFPNVKTVTVDAAFGGWKKAQATHFADGGFFDQMYKPGR